MATYKNVELTNPWWPTMTCCLVSLMGFHLSLQLFLRNARRLPSIDSLEKNRNDGDRCAFRRGCMRYW